MIDDIATIVISYLNLAQIPPYFNQHNMSETKKFKIDMAASVSFDSLKYIILRFCNMTLMGINVSYLNNLDDLLNLINVNVLKKLILMKCGIESLTLLNKCENLRVLKIEAVKTLDVELRNPKLKKIILNFARSGNVDLSGMTKVKTIIFEGRFSGVYGEEGLKKIKYVRSLDNNICYSDAHKFYFKIERMICIDLVKYESISCCNFEQLIKIRKDVEILIVEKLDGCVNLEILQKFTNLRKITFFLCKAWIDVSYLKNLIYLKSVIIVMCPYIQNISCLSSMKHLKCVHVEWCIKINTLDF